MPIPKPRENEKKNKFIDRCMSDDKMNTEYPDNKQRLAVCNMSWKDKNKKSRGNMAESKMEQRFFPVTEFRVERSDDGDDKIVGYAAVFNSLSDDLGGFREKIDPGAFQESINNKDDVRALFNHDSNYVLGRIKSNTLTLTEDGTGLRMENIPPDTQWAKDLQSSIDRGDIDQMSFGFRTISDRWEKKDEENIRTLEKASLFDVSVVTYPAYPETSVALRSMHTWEDEARDSVPNEDDDKNIVKDDEVVDKKDDGTEVTNPEDGTEVTNPEDKKDEVVNDKQEQTINVDVPVNLKLNVTIEQESKEVKVEDETKVEPLDDNKDDSDPSNENVDGDDSSNDEVNDNQQASDENVNEDENNSDDEQKPSEAEILAKQREREIQLKKKHITLEEL